MIKLLTSTAAAGLSALVAYGLDGQRGLEGAGVGSLIGLALCAVGSALLRWARRARGEAVLAAMLGSAAASLVLLAGAMVLLARVSPEILEPASLTALAIYLAWKFTEAFQSSSLSRPSRPVPQGGPR